MSALSAEDTKKLQAKCYLKLGNWQLAVREEMVVLCSCAAVVRCQYSHVVGRPVDSGGAGSLQQGH